MAIERVGIAETAFTTFGYSWARDRRME